jgi:hypothetical protein
MNVEQSVEWKMEEETQVLGENPPQCQLWPPQIPHGLTCDRNLTAVDRSRLLTSWVMERPGFVSMNQSWWPSRRYTVHEFMRSWIHGHWHIFKYDKHDLRLNILSLYESFFVQITSLILVSKNSPNFWTENLNISKSTREGGGGQIHIVRSDYPEHRYNVTVL